MLKNHLMTVRSHSIAYVCYDVDRCELCIEFRTGLAHKYLNVPKHIYLGLLSAQDADHYFADRIQYNYRFSRLPYYL